MSKLDYEVLNHGFCSSQYFQGCGTSFTRFTHVFTGAGMDAKEAYEDALEQAFSCCFENVPFDGGVPRSLVEQLPTRPRGIRARDKVPHEIAKHEDADVYWYVSIRLVFRTPEEEARDFGKIGKKRLEKLGYLP